MSTRQTSGSRSSQRVSREPSGSLSRSGCLNEALLQDPDSMSPRTHSRATSGSFARDRRGHLFDSTGNASSLGHDIGGSLRSGKSGSDGRNPAFYASGSTNSSGRRRRLKKPRSRREMISMNNGGGDTRGSLLPGGGPAGPPPPLQDEVRDLVVLAAPIFVAMISWVAMKTTDAAVVGHLGTKFLAASALSELWTSSTEVLVTGSVLGVFCGQAIGADEPKLAGAWLQVSLAVLAPVTLAVMGAWVLAGPVLRSLHPWLGEHYSDGTGNRAPVHK